MLILIVFDVSFLNMDIVEKEKEAKQALTKAEKDLAEAKSDYEANKSDKVKEAVYLAAVEIVKNTNTTYNNLVNKLADMQAQPSSSTGMQNYFLET